MDYDPKVILLTGGAGFIGSCVMVHLVKKYPETQMICLDKLDYCASVKNFEEIQNHKNFRFVRGDITSADLVNHIIGSYKVGLRRTCIFTPASTHLTSDWSPYMHTPGFEHSMHTS